MKPRVVYYNAKEDLIGIDSTGAQIFVATYYGPYQCAPWIFIDSNWEVIGYL